MPAQLRDDSTSSATTCSFSDATVDTFQGVTEEELTPYFEYICSAAQSYSESLLRKDAADPSIPPETSANVKFLLEKKFAYATFNRTELSGLQSECTITEWCIVNDALWCSVSCLLTYQYAGASTKTEEGTCYQFVLTNAQAPTIVDWYEGDKNSFDSKVRPFMADLKCSENWLENQDFSAIEAKCEKVLNDLKLSDIDNF